MPTPLAPLLALPLLLATVASPLAARAPAAPAPVAPPQDVDAATTEPAPRETPPAPPAAAQAPADADGRPTLAASAADDSLHPTLEQIFRPPTLHGLRPTGEALSPSGEWALWWWTDEHTEEPERDLWIGRTDGSHARVLHPAEHDVAAQWHPTEDSLLVRRDGWIFTRDPAPEGRPVPLLEVGERGRYAISHDGELLVASLGEDSQLWVLELPTGRRWRAAETLTGRSSFVSLAARAPVVALWADAPATAPAAEPPAADAPDDAAPPADATPAAPDAAGPAQRLWIVPLMGEREPVPLEVERSGRHELSPDGRWLLRHHSAYDFERELIMADYLAESVAAVDVRDSLAGDDGTRVELALHEVATGARWSPPLAGVERWYLRGEHFAPTGNQLLLDLLSNDFKVRQVAVVDPATRRTTVVAREYDPAWIGAPFWWAGWQDSGTVLFTSEQTGFNHLYRVPASGGEPEALTSGSCELRDLCEHAVERGRTTLVMTDPDDPATHRVLALDLASGARATLTPADGVGNMACLAPEGDTVLLRWATLGRPYEVAAARFAADADGALRPAGELTLLTDTAPAELDALDLPAPEIVRYRNPDDGVEISAYLYRPEPFDPTRRYPAVVFVHGAGSLQQVTRDLSHYEPNMLFHHRLARRGFFVLDPDFRHSHGYGRDFRAGIHGFMGGKDLDDVVAGVDFLESLGHVDTERVGIYGGSYGGFLTLMALFTRADVFACGAALRSVTDWRRYNHWYTNARLGHPQRDAENYARSSPLDHVDGLEDPLLILHGLRDNNVFAQDSIRLIEALIERGKDFDAMLYPSQGHGFTDPDSWIDEYKRIERLFVEVLRPAEGGGGRAEQPVAEPAGKPAAAAER